MQFCENAHILRELLELTQVPAINNGCLKILIISIVNSYRAHFPIMVAQCAEHKVKLHS